MLKWLSVVSVLWSLWVNAAPPAPVGKILLVASSQLDMGDKEEHQARNDLWEFAPPFHVFVMHGYQVDFVSPKGGEVPFMRDRDPVGMMSYSIKYEGFYDKSRQSMRPGDVDPTQYAAVFFGGGYGVMFDVAADPAMHQLLATLYQQGSWFGSSGHGAAGFANVRRPDGRYLVAGKKIAAFPDSTEREKSWAKQGTLLPFLLESQLRQHGALVMNKDNLADKTAVVVDPPFVTTMFLPSAALAAKELLLQLEKTARPAKG